MKLTAKNYHTPKNTFLSNSKMNDFIKDKRLFFNKHIEKSVPHETSDALIIGSAVDTLLFDGREAFDEQFVCVERRNSKSDISRTQLNKTQSGMVESLATAVSRTSAFAEVAKHKRQVVLTADIDVGEHFTGLCGMLDLFHFDKKTGIAIITDLKTAKTIDEKKYFFHCLQYGYFRQLATYGILVEHNFKPKKIIYRHLTVEKDPWGIYHTQTFEIDPALIDIARAEVEKNIEAIRVEKEFAPWDTSFKNPILISSMRAV